LSKKRGNGEGSIHRRKSGGWCAQFTVYTAKGRRRKTLYGTTRAEVAAKLTRAVADREQGLGFNADNVTLENFLKRWLSDSVRDSVRPITYEGYARQIRNHITPALGWLRLKALTSAHLRGLYREKLDSGLSPRTVQYIHVTLHKALKQAVNDGLVPRNVAEAVKAPQVRREEIKPLSPEQARTLLKAAREDRIEALYVLAVTAGLRQGELLGLKWEDVDLNRSVLQVRCTLAGTRGGSPVFGIPKTPKSRRGVRLTAGATEALRRHRTAQKEQRRKLGTLWQDHGLVFTTQIGTPLNRHNVTTRSFKPLLKQTGLPEIRFHDLRHTCATLMLVGGIHPKVVQEMLGHANVTITLDTYSHLLPDMQDIAVEKLDELLS
jgi:integrase